MMLEKFEIKNYLYCLGIFIIGMLSVSIANIFNGYYWAVATIVVILTTILIYNYFDKKERVKENLVNIILISTVTLFEIIFFIVNDIFGKTVYIKNNLGFWGICVIISQFFSICSIIYISVRHIMNLNNAKIEIVDNKSLAKEEEEPYEETISNSKKSENPKVEVKSITENSIRNNPPFMEEEK